MLIAALMSRSLCCPQSGHVQDRTDSGNFSNRQPQPEQRLLLPKAWHLDASLLPAHNRRCPSGPHQRVHTKAGKTGNLNRAIHRHPSLRLWMDNSAHFVNLQKHHEKGRIFMFFRKLLFCGLETIRARNQGWLAALI